MRWSDAPARPTRKRALLFVLLLSACARREGIVGHWKSGSDQTQLGQSTFEMCFRSDGSFSARGQTQAGEVRNEGRYELRGMTLRTVGKDGLTSEEHVEIRGDTLLVGGSGAQTAFHREGGGCP